MVVDLDYEAAHQLSAELKDSIHRALATRRPVLTHLNADTTWLLSVPYPNSVPTPTSRSRFNILIDPWLQGPQSDVASWFSTQWHVVKSSVQTIIELNSILAQTERIDQGQIQTPPVSSESKPYQSFIDVVAISHEFTDHCHKATLLEIDPSVPVFATTKAVDLIKSWNHFERVIDMPPFSKDVDWRSTSVDPLPSWLGISRLVTQADSLYYHSAVIICIKKSEIEDGAEAVIYTPHGVEATTFGELATAEPPVETLAFLHGLHDVSITLTKQLNLGAHNALKAQRQLKAKYWVGTHDEVKKGGGFIAPFLRRKAYSVRDALVKERRNSANGDGTAKHDLSEDISYAELGSGQSLLLE